jgi:hypothetical protein
MSYTHTHFQPISIIQADPLPSGVRNIKLTVDSEYRKNAEKSIQKLDNYVVTLQDDDESLVLVCNTSAVSTETKLQNN